MRPTASELLERAGLTAGLVRMMEVLPPGSARRRGHRLPRTVQVIGDKPVD